ncbi:MAG: S1C family serine protease [Patescibacteria group bacterium]
MSNLEKKKFTVYQIITVILIAVFCGFSAGLVGEIWISDFIKNGKVEKEKIESLSDRLDALTQKQEKRLKDILAEKDSSINQTIDQIRPTIVSFYKFKPQTGNWSDILLDQDITGLGTVLTTDGWILTDKAVLAGDTNQIAVSFEKKIYAVVNYVCDSATTACFVKIDAQDLPVVNLTSREFMTSGQTVLAVSADLIFPTSIECLYCSVAKTRSDLIRSSEKYYQFIKLIEPLNDNWLGAPIVNLDGQLVGVLSSDNVVVAVDNIQSIMKQAISSGAITRNFLGVSYIDLSEAVGWQKYADYKQGALLFGVDGSPAVMSASPAQLAGLKSGDIILSIEDELITDKSSLTKIIQSYKSGQEVKIKIMRQGQPLEVNAVLTEM